MGQQLVYQPGHFLQGESALKAEQELLHPWSTRGPHGIETVGSFLKRDSQRTF